MRGRSMLGGSATAVAAVLLAMPSAAARAVTPISVWTIEASEARCVAVRRYGDPDKPITLAVKAPPTGNALQLAVIRHAYRKSSDQVGASVLVDGRPFHTYALGYPISDRKQTVSLIHLPPEAAVALRDAATIAVNIKGSPDDVFPLRPMADTWTRMDECLNRLRKTWNIGADGSSETATNPKALVPIAGMLSPRDFPPQVITNVWSGTTRFLLLIDEKGAVKDCTLTESSGIAVIDSRTCAVISYKARFSPAMSADGRPAKGAFAQSITWRVTN